MSISPRVDEAIELTGAPLRLGIMGGTFDPIHFGHLICAEQAREQFDLDYVVFMPTGNPVFKMDREVSSAETRYEMVVTATRKNPKFDVSRIEVDREGATYTYDTLVEMREQMPKGSELYFITGADAIMSVLKWRNAELIIKMAHFVAASRPGYDYSELRQWLESEDEYQQVVTFFEVPGLAISSTDMRARVKAGKSIVYMTPISVVAVSLKKKHYLGEKPPAGSVFAR